MGPGIYFAMGFSLTSHRQDIITRDILPLLSRIKHLSDVVDHKLKWNTVIETSKLNPIQFPKIMPPAPPPPKSRSGAGIYETVAGPSHPHTHKPVPPIPGQIPELRVVGTKTDSNPNHNRERSPSRTTNPLPVNTDSVEPETPKKPNWFIRFLRKFSSSSKSNPKEKVKKVKPEKEKKPKVPKEKKKPKEAKEKKDKKKRK